ncbi:MAG: recombinase family protein, partial [Halomonadaceae bacterium]|nr:recombinase family protein [Halomonadaceae bacterium]
NKAAIDALVDYVREGDVVVITKLDRLGRSLKQVLNVLDQLKEKEVNVVALDQPIDTTNDSPMAQAMTQLLGVFAELERSFIVSRTQEGKAASGRYGGRPKKLNLQQINEVKRRHSEGESIAGLARYFEVSRMTIRRQL